MAGRDNYKPGAKLQKRVLFLVLLAVGIPYLFLMGASWYAEKAYDTDINEASTLLNQLTIELESLKKANINNKFSDHIKRLEQSHKQALLLKSEMENSADTLYTIILTMRFLTIIVGMIAIYYIFIGIRNKFLIPFEELASDIEKVSIGEIDKIEEEKLGEELLQLGVLINKSYIGIKKVISKKSRDAEKPHGNGMNEVFIAASSGDLSQRLGDSDESITDVANNVNKLLDNVSKAIVQIQEIGYRVSISNKSVQNVAKKIAIDGKRQTRELHHVHSVLNRTSQNLQKTSLEAELASEDSHAVTLSSKNCSYMLHESVQKMQIIRNNAQITAKTMKTLGDKTLDINAIVELINGISHRTNILSLNASIEASKAGEQGKGFAVVADEIRKLADRTSSSTKEISSYIEDIQVETSEAVLAMEEMISGIELGWSQIENTAKTINNIQDVASVTAERVMEISIFMKEIIGRFAHMEEEIKSIDQVTKHTLEGIHLSHEETRNLANSIRGLINVARSFRLEHDYEQDLHFDHMLPDTDDSLEVDDSLDTLMAMSNFSTYSDLHTIKIDDIKKAEGKKEEEETTKESEEQEDNTKSTETA